MRFIQGQDRTQTHLFPISLDQSIAKDNEIRLIDIFVDSLDLNDFGFKVDFDENGRPAYRPSDLLKLYIYGYLNRTRSSRALEKECKRNIEVMWLLRNLRPDHNTISNFRRDNPKAINPDESGSSNRSIVQIFSSDWWGIISWRQHQTQGTEQ